MAKKKTYTVIYEIELHADSPREAAEEAWEYLRDPESYPPYFIVKDEKGVEVDVDLAKSE